MHRGKVEHDETLINSKNVANAAASVVSVVALVVCCWNASDYCRSIRRSQEFTLVVRLSV